MHVFKHPKYYEEMRQRAKRYQKELRERNKSDQAISGANATAKVERAPDSGLKPQASSSKPQAKPEPSSGSQDAGRKPQAPSSRVQASSHKRQAP